VAHSVKVTFSDEEYGALRSEAGYEPMAGFCRRRILSMIPVPVDSCFTPSTPPMVGDVVEPLGVVTETGVVEPKPKKLPKGVTRGMPDDPKIHGPLSNWKSCLCDTCVAKRKALE
jgi:hypothetical protein